MIEDIFVIDAVVHGFNFNPNNYQLPQCQQIVESAYQAFHVGFSPRNDPKWILDYEHFTHMADYQPEILAQTMFAESWTDYVIYHEVPMWGLWKDGSSPLWIGQALRQRYPNRAAVFGGISPFQPNAVEEVDRLVEEEKVTAIKLYPQDIIEGVAKGWRMDDPELAFPIFERARAKGLKVISIHKAVPVGPFSLEPFKVSDVEGAAAAFPDLTFEVVHGGAAFMEETAMLLQRFPNVVVNLEGNTMFATNMRGRFIQMLWPLLASAGPDRVIWSVGALGIHPQPVLEAFWNLEFPQELVEEFGAPQLTKEVKRKILGENIARILGWDIEAMKKGITGDTFSQRTELAEPWSLFSEEPVKATSKA